MIRFWRFADPEMLLLTLLLPFLVYYFVSLGSRRTGTILYSDIGLLRRIRPSRSLKFRHILRVLRILTLLGLIAAIARPQSGMTEEQILAHGVDIMLALDISTSMMAEDLKEKTTRLDIAKQVIRDFIKTRQHDRIGLVVFAAKSFIQCPLTLDYGVLISFLDRVTFAPREWDGTAIGMALANCVNRLRDSDARSRIIILLTDGENNTGAISPVTGAELAKAMKIKIFTVGAGSNRPFAPIKVHDSFLGDVYQRIPVRIDEPTLQEIAATTGGQYRRALDADQLEQIYKEISGMEKSRIEVKQYTEYTELFQLLLLPAIAVLLLEIILANTRYRKLP